MAGALRKTMVYLGLAEEDERYDGYEGYEEETSGRTPATQANLSAAEADGPEDRRAQVTPIKRDRQVARVVPEPVGGELSRITTIHPRSYNDAKAIGESFRQGIPVIMNLTDMDDSDAKRLVDFSAGLIFGLRGAIERVTNKVFLLSPAHVEVTGEEPARARTGSSAAFFNQS
ncbi:MAG TPA: cell division protein SepF [Actinomycetales bacterium]|nr:cell division protein SepF [Actinomycetales bacterium]